MTALADHGIRLRTERPGQHRAACPRCAEEKARTGDTALAVRIDDRGATWHCHRCGWKGSTRRQVQPSGHDRPRRQPAAPPKPAKGPTGLPDAAASLWRACRPIEPGAIAAAYLERRGCALPHPEGDLRWHPELRRSSGHIGPGLVALVTDPVSVKPMSLHRTWLAPDGSGKAPLDRPRLFWPGTRKLGGVCRLWPDEEVTLGLCVAEGLETALGAARGFGLAWATIDAGNLADLPVLAGIDALTIIADHDPPNPKTGWRAGLAAANACAERWLRAGCEVRIWLAPREGEDFNDLARGAA